MEPQVSGLVVKLARVVLNMRKTLDALAETALKNTSPADVEKYKASSRVLDESFDRFLDEIDKVIKEYQEPESRG